MLDQLHRWNEKVMGRREWLTRAAAMAAGSLIATRVSAQQGLLPLRATGLDHVSITVPDSKQAATYYGHIFDPQLFHERTGVQRYYVRLGAAYIAFGPQANAMPYIDHIAAGVLDFDEDKFGDASIKAELTAAGLTAPPGGLPMLSDPDQSRLQLVNSTHGIFDTIMAGGRVHAGPGILTPIGLDQIRVAVRNLDTATAHYRKLFGRERTEGGSVSFQVNDGRLRLEPVADGAKPGFPGFTVKVAPFDPAAAKAALEQAGVKVEASAAKSLRFRDLHNLPVEAVSA